MVSFSLYLQTKPCVTHLPFYNWPGRNEDLHNGCVIQSCLSRWLFCGRSYLNDECIFRLGQDPFPGMHHLTLSSQVISLSIWTAVSHFWCLLIFNWGWLQAWRCGGGMREEEEGTPRSKSRCKYVSISTIGVTGTYRVVPKGALIFLP